MYHSITFGDKNTYDDWHLIPSTRPVFNPPSVNTNIVQIPGTNGVLDLSEYLTGYITYGNRTGSLEFIVENGHEQWSKIYSKVMNYLHGKKLKAVLEDDSSYYYEGRFSVNQWKSDQYYSTITIDYNVYPYKKEITSSMEDWLWDPFDFEDGIIRNYANISVPARDSYTLIIPARSEPILLKAKIESPVYITIDGGERKYFDKSPEGLETDIGMIIGEYDHTIFIEPGIVDAGSTISLDYRGGSL